MYGQPATLQHLVEIAKHVVRHVERLPADERGKAIETARKEWIVRWHTHGLTSREIRGHADGSDVDPGPPDTTPRDVLAFARATKSQADSEANKLEHIESKLAELIDSDADARTEKGLESLQGIIDSLERKRKTISDQIQAIRKRVKVLKEELEFDRDSPPRRNAA